VRRHDVRHTQAVQSLRVEGVTRAVHGRPGTVWLGTTCGLSHSYQRRRPGAGMR